ncbi:MAG: hypothetical protein LBI78_04295 [Campylobacteraceae bacterium]|jgi:hypothetical protein|nr:hypothetical protein [Campylobacteraceae bacterium]
MAVDTSICTCKCCCKECEIAYLFPQYREKIDNLAKEYFNKTKEEFMQKLLDEYLRLRVNSKITSYDELEKLLYKFIQNNKDDYYPKTPLELKKEQSKSYLLTRIGTINPLSLENLTKSELIQYINSDINKNYSSIKKRLAIDIINNSTHKEIYFIVSIIFKSRMEDNTLLKIIEFGSHFEKQTAILNHYVLCCETYNRLALYKSRTKKSKVPKGYIRTTPSTILSEFCHKYKRKTGDEIMTLHIANYFKNLFGFKKANSTLTGDYKRIPKMPNKKTLSVPLSTV